MGIYTGQSVQTFIYKMISSGDLMYSTVTTVNSIVHVKFARRIDLKHFHTQKVNM